VALALIGLLFWQARSRRRAGSSSSSSGWAPWCRPSFGLGLIDALWLELLVFAICSVVSLLLFRNRLLERFPRERQPDADDLIGKEAKAAETIPSGGTGKVDMRGTSWNAQNAGPRPFNRARPASWRSATV